jgi:predicted  nucleic acid-binding Zn-ribbon protein
MPDPTISVTASGGLEIPVEEVLTGRGWICGKSGSGKSNTLGVIAEELLKQGFPLLIVDPDGEHYGLKEQYELLHVGADESCDVQVEPPHADRLAKIALEEGVPMILDVSGFLEEADAHELIQGVAHALFSKGKKLKRPYPVFVEEAHEFIPETNHPDDTAKSLIRLAKRGRKHGIGLTSISQRPANVNKDMITQSNWQVWHTLTWPNDTSVVKNVLDAEYAEAVQELDTGEAFLLADWMDEVRTVMFKRKETFDAGQTPGLDDFERPELKEVSSEIIEGLQEITHEAEAEEDRIAELEATVEQKDARIRDLEDQLDSVEDGGGDGGGVSEERAEQLQERIEELKKQRDNHRRKATDLRDDLTEMDQEREQLQNRVNQLNQREEEIEVAAGNIQDALEVLGHDAEIPVAGDADLDDLRDRIEGLEQERDEWKERAQAGGGVDLGEFEEYEDFLESDAVQKAIDDAKDDNRVSPRYVSGVVATILRENGAVSYEEIATALDVSTTSDISKAATRLENRGVVQKGKQNGETMVDLNLGGIEKIIKRREEQARTEELLEKL